MHGQISIWHMWNSNETSTVCVYSPFQSKTTLPFIFGKRTIMALRLTDIIFNIQYSLLFHSYWYWQLTHKTFFFCPNLDEHSKRCSHELASTICDINQKSGIYISNFNIISYWIALLSDVCVFMYEVRS